MNISRLALAGVSVYSSIKIIQLTANDEWGDLKYKASHMLQADLGEKKTKVVVLGTGWGALSVVQKLDHRTTDVTVISPRSFFFYTPLLAGTATGTVCHTSISEPIRWHTSRFGSANYIQGECISVDFTDKTVHCSGNVDVQYDHLVIAVGAQPATFGIPGVAEHCIFMKEIEDGLKVQKRLLESLEFANRLIVAGAPDDQINRALHWVVIGGGPTGVELTAEISDFIRSDVSQYFPQLKDRVKVTILEATGKILGMFDPKVSAYAERTLKENGAEVMCDAVVTTVSDQVITLKRKGSPVSVEYGVAVWAGGIAARPFTQSLALTIGGLQAPPGKPIRGLVVDNKFRVRDAPMAAGAPACVWAIGDCALSGSAPTAQAAFQHGSYLGRMLRDSNFDSAAIELYHPFQMVNFGAMAYVGASKGVAELKSVLWDKHPVKGQEERPTVVEGAHAFALWRSLYFSRLLSNRNKAQVVFDWSRAAIFGRDIASPFTLREENPKK